MSKMQEAKTIFRFSTGALLAITGALKIMAVFSKVKILETPEPLFGIPFQYFFLIAGLIELFVAIVCLFGKNEQATALLLAWLSTCFLIYRVGLWWMDWKGPCKCLGNLTDWLHVTPSTADLLIKTILIYILVGSYSIIFFRRTSKLIGSILKL